MELLFRMRKKLEDKEESKSRPFSCVEPLTVSLLLPLLNAWDGTGDEERLSRSDAS